MLENIDPNLIQAVQSEWQLITVGLILLSFLTLALFRKAPYGIRLLVFVLIWLLLVAVLAIKFWVEPSAVDTNGTDAAATVDVDCETVSLQVWREECSSD